MISLVLFMTLIFTTQGGKSNYLHKLEWEKSSHQTEPLLDFQIKGGIVCKDNPQTIYVHFYLTKTFKDF